MLRTLVKLRLKAIRNDKIKDYHISTCWMQQVPSLPDFFQGKFSVFSSTGYVNARDEAADLSFRIAKVQEHIEK